MSMDDTTVQEKPLINEDLQEIYLIAKKEMYKAGQEEMIKRIIADMCIHGVKDFINILEDDTFKKYGKGIFLFPPLTEQELPYNMLLQPEEISMMETQILSNLKQVLSIMGLQNSIKIEVKSC